MIVGKPVLFGAKGIYCPRGEIVCGGIKSLVEYVPEKAEGEDVFEGVLGCGFGGPGCDGCIRQFRVYDGSFGLHGSLGKGKEDSVTWPVILG